MCGNLECGRDKLPIACMPYGQQCPFMESRNWACFPKDSKEEEFVRGLRKPELDTGGTEMIHAQILGKTKGGNSKGRGRTG